MTPYPVIIELLLHCIILNANTLYFKGRIPLYVKCTVGTCLSFPH